MLHAIPTIVTRKNYSFNIQLLTLINLGCQTFLVLNGIVSNGKPVRGLVNGLFTCHEQSTTCDKNIVTHWDFPCHPCSMLVTGGIVCYLRNINRFLPTLRRGKGGRNAAVDILPVSQRFLSGVVCTVMQQVNPINLQAINAIRVLDSYIYL